MYSPLEFDADWPLATGTAVPATPAATSPRIPQHFELLKDFMVNTP
jgi:hypothetical protein